MSMELADKLYTSTQVADILGVSLRTLYRYMEDSKIQSMRTASGRHRFTRDQIFEFLNTDQQSTFTPGVPDEVLQEPHATSVAPRFAPQAPTKPESVNPFSQSPASSTFSRQETTTASPTPTTGTQTPPFTTAGPNANQANVAPVTSPSYKVPDTQPTSPWIKTEPLVGRQNPVDQTAVPFTGSTPQDRIVKPIEPVQKTEQPVSQILPASVPRSETAPEPTPGVRYYKSDFADLIELAKRVKETANLKDLEYAFTLYAGLSLHFLIKPFTLLHIYANPEDIQIWKNELRLTSVSDKKEANIAVIVNTDIVFVPVKEIGGFKVVDDKVLLRDLSDQKEEELLGQFRQYLSNA